MSEMTEMADLTPADQKPAPVASAPPGWNVPLEAALCPHCDWRYFVPAGAAAVRCPHCCRADLKALDARAAQLPYEHPPELVLPFSVTRAVVDRHIEQFAEGIPFAPQDLTPDALRGRVRRLYVPMWLVDAAVTATWEAEVGFDYQVVSHQERYADGAGWSTREVEETRVRWEPRVGRLQRQYDNVLAPALEDHRALEQAVGAYQTGTAEPYGGALADVLVRLPDRAPEAAWPDAQPNFYAAATAECLKAAQADHIRQYRWSPAWRKRNWTLLLMPLYATYYLDDEEQPQPVLINAQSGRVHGTRRASMRRAQKRALILAVVAAVILVLSLIVGLVGLVLLPLIAVGAVGGLIGLAVGVGAIAPLVRVWSFNRQPAEA